MIMQAIDLLHDNPDPTEAEVREGIEGNLCRCTGYQNIVRTSAAAAARRRDAGPRSRPPEGRVTAVEDPPDRPRVRQARRRKEDARLITGRTRWTDNIALPGMLHLAMVRSPLAHARITVDRHVGGPRRPGVVGVLQRRRPRRRPGRPALRLAGHRRT